MRREPRRAARKSIGARSRDGEPLAKFATEGAVFFLQPSENRTDRPVTLTPSGPAVRQNELSYRAGAGVPAPSIHHGPDGPILSDKELLYQ